MVRLSLIFTLVFMGFMVIADDKPEDTFIIGVNNAYENNGSSVVVDALFKTMYAPLAITPHIMYLPSKRGLQLANQNKIDADAGRVLSVAKDYENLIVVNEALLNHPVYMFCLKAKECVKDKDLLYAVMGGFQAAYPYCEKYKLDCFFENNFSFMGNMLSSGSADVLIGNKKLIISSLCNSDLAKIYYRQENDLNIVSYHLVSSKHADKVTVLEKSIRDMHQRGDFNNFVAFYDLLPTDCTTKFINIK